MEFMLFILFILTYSGISVESNEMEEWAREINGLFKDLNELMLVEKLEDIYSSKDYHAKEINDEVAKEFLMDSVAKISKIVNETEHEVLSLKNDTEDAYEKFAKTNYSEIIADLVRSERENETNCYVRSKLVSSDPTKCVNNLHECDKSYCMKLERDPMLNNMQVNKSISTAHVPTNVYDLSILLRTVGNWTQSLNDIFTNNRKNDITLKWQYFCSSSGLFKFFPGIAWHIQQEDNEKFIDFFDCRSQSWYLGASSYPKEMVILMDKSGSMKGLNNIISNATMAEILNTLTENDFFNIIMFDHEAHFADPQLNSTMIQGTKQNKYKMIHSVSKFSPNSTANYESALRKAFGLFGEWENNIQTSRFKGCNQQIMIITDSAPESFDVLLNDLNPEKSVRIFTYLIGQQSTEEEILLRMACNNRGFAVSITALSDVKENVLKYLDVVARSNALTNKEFMYWTGPDEVQFKANKEEIPTQDSVATTNTTALELFINAKKKGQKFLMQEEIDQKNSMSKEEILAPRTEDKTIIKMTGFKQERPEMYTSAAMASYDRTEKSKSLNKGILLGVVGVDVALQEFMDTARSFKIGPNAYLFAVNNNGHVLFHPNYRPMYKKKMKVFYQSVDINEVEIPHQVVIDNKTGLPSYDGELRSMMIGRKTDSVMMTTETVFNNFRNSFSTMRKYFTAPIDKTPFVIGLALPWNDNKADNIPDFVVDESRIKEDPINYRYFHQKFTGNTCPEEDFDIATLINYEFCEFDEKLKSLYLINPICALQEILKDTTRYRKVIETCNIKYVNSIINDAINTDFVTDEWEKLTNTVKNYHFSVQQFFTWHHSGLIRIKNYTKLLYPDFINDHIYGSEDEMYRLTLLTEKEFGERIFVFHAPVAEFYTAYDSNKKNVTFEITKAIYRNSQDRQTAFAVTGIQLVLNQFNDILKSKLKDCGLQGNCYVITESLIIIYNSGAKKVGQPLKEVECDVVKELREKNIATEKVLFDFQGICMEPAKKVESFSMRLFNPITQLFKFSFHLIWQFILLSQNIFQTLAYENNPFLGKISSINYTDHDENAHIRIQITSKIQECKTAFEAQSATYDMLRNKTFKSNDSMDKSSNLSNLPLKEKDFNFTKPGDLMECLKKVVKTHCSSNNNFTPSTGRFQCDTTCEIIRNQYPRIIGELDLCQEPNNPCNKRFNFLILNTRKAQTNSGNSNCGDCKKSWKIQRIEETNLFLLLVQREKNCKCDCSNFRSDGNQIPANKTAPLPFKARLEISQLDKCEMIPQERENSTYCDALQMKTNSLILFTSLFYILIISN